MEEFNQAVEPERLEGLDVERAVDEAERETLTAQGRVHISEDVITELARQSLQRVPGIQPATAGIASKLGLGRKVTEGVKVTVDEGENPSISVDAFLMVRYGLRIPDLAWDVQEKVKNDLERTTGYTVNYVNIYVQGIYFNDPKPEPESVPSAEDGGPAADFIMEPPAPDGHIPGDHEDD